LFGVVGAGSFVGQIFFRLFNPSHLSVEELLDLQLHVIIELGRVCYFLDNFELSSIFAALQFMCLKCLVMNYVLVRQNFLDIFKSVHYKSWTL